MPLSVIVLSASAMCLTGGQDSRLYAGTVSVTENGRPCQRWDSQAPHTHNTNPNNLLGTTVSTQCMIPILQYLNEVIELMAEYMKLTAIIADDLEAADAFCRDPDGKGAPWCYTMDPDHPWEYCNVPVCEGKNN